MKAIPTKYQMLLSAKAKELAAAVSGREGIAVQGAAETIEETMLSDQREMAVRTLDQSTRQLREVRVALQRLANGTYGWCEECEREISGKRLDALPWARYCVRCQERAEAQGPRIPEAPFQLAA